MTFKITAYIRRVLLNKLYFAYLYKDIKTSKQLIKKVNKDIEDIEQEINEEQ